MNDDSFDLDIWQFQHKRARRTAAGGIAALVIGVLAAVGAIVVFILLMPVGGAALGAPTASLTAFSMGAFATGGALWTSGSKRLARLNSERHDAWLRDEA